MEYIKHSDLSFLGKGAIGNVYKYLKPYGSYGLDVVVKVTRNARQSIANYEKLREIACPKPFACLCSVEGQEAILMENLYTDSIVYVSPNSLRLDRLDNIPEGYLCGHKILGIANMNSLLCQLRDLVHCSNDKGIELTIDMPFFGVPKNVDIPDVSYKIVDVDGMLWDDSRRGDLFEWNLKEMKWALKIFIQYCVVKNAQKCLMEQIDKFSW